MAGRPISMMAIRHRKIGRFWRACAGSAASSVRRWSPDPAGGRDRRSPFSVRRGSRFVRDSVEPRRPLVRRVATSLARTGLSWQGLEALPRQRSHHRSIRGAASNRRRETFGRANGGVMRPAPNGEIEDSGNARHRQPTCTPTRRASEDSTPWPIPLARASGWCAATAPACSRAVGEFFSPPMPRFHPHASTIVKRRISLF